MEGTPPPNLMRSARTRLNFINEEDDSDFTGLGTNSRSTKKESRGAISEIRSRGVSEISGRSTVTKKGLMKPGKTKALATAFAELSGATFLWPQKAEEPWLDQEGTHIWPIWRERLAKIVLSKTFETAMLFIILGNLVLIIYETDQEAKCFPEHKNDLSSCDTAMKNIPWLYATNLCLLTLYTLEVTILLIVKRSEYIFYEDVRDDSLLPRLQRMNLLDFFVCVVGWVSEFFDLGINVSWLRIIRVCRVLRHPYIKRVQELHGMVSGFAASMKAIAFGAALICGTLVFSSILVVQYIHPLNLEIDHGTCDRCPRSFETVGSSSLTLFQQIIAGDSWGQISIPNIEKDWKAAILLPLVNFVIGLGVTNLILAVIVDRAIEAREITREDAFKERMKRQKERKVNLVNLFQKLDVDHNGVLDFDELSDAYMYCNEFKVMMLEAGLHYKDLREVFEFLDDNANGEIEYIELCNALDDSTQRDASVVSALAKMKIETSSRKIRRMVDKVYERLDIMDRKLDRLLGDQPTPTTPAPSRFPSRQESDKSPSRQESDKSNGGATDELENVKVSSKPVACAQVASEKLELRPQTNSVFRLAPQTSVTTATATVTVEQQDNMIDLLRSLHDLKMNIDRQFQQQVARSTKFEAEVSSALTCLGRSGVKLPSVSAAPLTPGRLNSTPRIATPSPYLATPRSCTSADGQLRTIGKDFPARELSSERSS